MGVCNVNKLCIVKGCANMEAYAVTQGECQNLVGNRHKPDSFEVIIPVRETEKKKKILSKEREVKD